MLCDPSRALLSFCDVPTVCILGLCSMSCHFHEKKPESKKRCRDHLVPSIPLMQVYSRALGNFAAAISRYR